jgi:exopolysaccharide biosynthesis polyprenyl glycosylphosphotransferase
MGEGAAQQSVRSYPLSAPRRAAAVRLSPKLHWQLTQVGADMATVFAAAVLTYALYLGSGVGKGHYEPLFYLQLGVLFSSTTVFALHGYGAYRDELGLLRIDAIRKILRAVFAGGLFTLGLTFLVRLPDFSRITLVMVGPVAVLALVSQRFLLWRLASHAGAERAAARKVLIYGAGETGRLLAQHLLDEHHLNLRAVGFFDDDVALHRQEIKVGPGTEGARVPVFGGEESIAAVLEMTGAEIVFVAMPSAPSQRITYLISRLEAHGVPFFFVPSAGELLFSTLRFGQIAGMPVFARRLPDASRFYGAVKRAIDLAGSILLLTLTAPLFAVGALVVRISSSGPVFFTQQRVGLNGETFTIFKLRTMTQDSPKYALHPDSSKDDRVTRIGYWLRRLSIDELPQLINVLRGEMSLVGPRPEMPFVVDDYNEIQRQRLSAKPGITGLWQISADRAFKIHDNIQYDLYYVEHRTTGLDLAIMVVTPFVLLARNRAM